jgi:hypothetical protein
MYDYDDEIYYRAEFFFPNKNKAKRSKIKEHTSSIWKINSFSFYLFYPNDKNKN